MFVGHEATAKTVRFLLFNFHPSKPGSQLTAVVWELANNRHAQESLRAEIMETLERIKARGDNDFTVNDFDSMPYLLAVGKVCQGSVHLSTRSNHPVLIGNLEG